MSSIAVNDEAAGADAMTAADEQHEAHDDKVYIKIALMLFVLTAIEIALPIIFEGDGKVYGPMLLVLMGVKFWVVASYFMHLRFDNVLLTRVFYAGLILAVAVYIAVLSAMNFWTDSGIDKYDDPPPQITTTTAAPAG
jgi:cytochrome c oxidase subunit 4